MAINRIAAAAALVRAGAIIEVDSGDYLGDVAVWEHDNIVVQPSAGRCCTKRSVRRIPLLPAKGGKW